MIRSRIKKDLSIQWSIFATDGTTSTPYYPDADSVVMLLTPYNRIKISDAQIVGNEVRWTFEGRQQKYLGIYSLELIENDGQKGMLTVDSCKAFELVAHTCEESLEADGAIQAQTVLLESTVLISIGSAYDDTDIKKELVRLDQNKADKSKLTELSAEVGKKVDANFVNNAIATAITNELNSDF